MHISLLCVCNHLKHYSLCIRNCPVFLWDCFIQQYYSMGFEITNHISNTQYIVLMGTTDYRQENQKIIIYL